MAATDVKRPKQLEQENARLQKMLAERDLELDVMKELRFRSFVDRRLASPTDSP